MVRHSLLETSSTQSHLHTLQVIDALNRCHKERSIAKFWGVCTDQKLALDACFRQEKKDNRSVSGYDVWQTLYDAAPPWGAVFVVRHRHAHFLGILGFYGHSFCQRVVARNVNGQAMSALEYSSSTCLMQSTQL